MPRPGSRLPKSSWARSRKLEGFGADLLGTQDYGQGSREVLVGCDGGSGDEGQELDRLVRQEAAVQGLEEGPGFTRLAEALGQARAKCRQGGARGEHVGERKEGECFEGSHRALRLGIESAETLQRIAQELQAYRRVVVRGEDVQDAPSPGHLAGAGDGVLAPIAALVEGLHEDLGRHLVAGPQADHPRLEQVGGQNGAEETRRRSDEGEKRSSSRGEQGARAPQRRVGMPGETAEGRRSGRREGKDRARPPGLTGQSAQVIGHPLDVALAGDDDEQGRLAREQRHEQPGRAERVMNLQTTGLQADPGHGEERRVAEGVEPAHGVESAGGQRWRIWSRRDEVERPATRSTRTTRPPAASTSARPTMASFSQSAPFTSTSGRRAAITSRGVSSP